MGIAAQGADIMHHIADTAWHDGLALHSQNRNRSLGRDPLNPAADEAVQHQIADRQDAVSGRPVQHPLRDIAESHDIQVGAAIHSSGLAGFVS